jgi:hypothetical protein
MLKAGSLYPLRIKFIIVDAIMKRLLELVDAVRARHVTPVISTYCIVVAEPYFAGFRRA